MNGWSRKDREPEVPEQPAEEPGGWNPRREGGEGADAPEPAAEPGEWSTRTRAKTPRERALSRRERPAAEPAQDPPAEPAQAAPPEPEPAAPTKAFERPRRAERSTTPRSEEWRSGGGPSPAAPAPAPAPPRPEDDEAERKRERELAELRARLERAERALPPALRGQPRTVGERMQTQASTAVRLLVALAIFVTFVTAPLLMIYRSSCPQRGIERQRWSFVPPGGDKPEGCRDHRSGLQVLLGAD